MSRGLIGAGLGAGGASVYFSGLGDSLRFVLDHGMGFTRGSGGANMADKHYDELYRMVQQLSTEMGRKQQGITIVHGADSKGHALYYVTAVAVGGVIYLRVWRGWRLVDMMYVTRASLKQSVGHLSEGLEGLGQRLTSVKTYLQSQIKALSSKQDQTMAAQAAMQEHLGHVGADVESTRIEVSEMHGSVREMEANMEQLSLSQQYANRGIYLLCKVVGDMMKGPTNGGPRASSAAELDSYIRHPPTVGGRVVPGLEGVLQEAGDSRSGRGSPAPLSRGALDAGRLARAATETAMQPPDALGGKRFTDSSGGGPDRSYSVGDDRHGAGGMARSGFSGRHGGGGGGGGYGGMCMHKASSIPASGGHVGGGWQHSEASSPRDSLASYPETPSRSTAGGEHRPSRHTTGDSVVCGGGGGGGTLGRRGTFGKLAPWDRQPSSGASSFDNGPLLEARY